MHLCRADFMYLDAFVNAQTRTYSCAHFPREGQLDSAARRYKELEERNRKLQVEVASLNTKIKLKNAEMAQLHDSYEAAFEEKMANMQEYVKQLEDRLRNCSLAKLSSSSGGSATAVSPEGTYVLKSSLMYEGCQDVDRLAATQTSEEASGDVPWGQKDVSFHLLSQMEGSIQNLQCALSSISAQLISRGFIPVKPDTIQQGCAGEETQLQTFMPRVVLRGDTDNMDLTSEMQISAIANLSAATFVLSSPHVDHSDQSLRANNPMPPHPDVEIGHRNQLAVPIPAECRAQLFAANSGQARGGEVSNSSAIPGLRGERAKNADPQNGDSGYVAYADRPQMHHQPFTAGESLQMAHGRRKLSPFQVAFDTCSPGVGARQRDVLSSYRDEFEKGVKAGMQDDDIHSASERAAREERFRERESLLLSLTEFPRKADSSGSPMSARSMHSAYQRHVGPPVGGGRSRGSEISLTELALTSSFGVWTGSSFRAAVKHETQPQAKRNEFWGIRPAGTQSPPSEDMQTVMARMVRQSHSPRLRRTNSREGQVIITSTDGRLHEIDLSAESVTLC
eukprot:Tamp_03283.p1 GENE.Tamp_03283~~Tamp_03283.p1  ORF type:complete len:565 (-),score=66.16 Tamp_03283:718-2412(-)